MKMKNSRLQKFVPREYSPYVEITPNIMGGRSVVKDTRIPTRLLFAKYGKGKTIGELAQLFDLPEDTVERVIAYEVLITGARKL